MPVRLSLKTTVRQALSPRVGRTQASRVMPVFRSSVAASATVTQSLTPSKLSALPFFPVVQVAPEMVPALPLPERSASVVPEPASNEYAATGVGGGGSSSNGAGDRGGEDDDRNEERGGVETPELFKSHQRKSLCRPALGGFERPERMSLKRRWGGGTLATLPSTCGKKETCEAAQATDGGGRLGPRNCGN